MHAFTSIPDSLQSQDVFSLESMTDKVERAYEELLRDYPAT